MVLLAQAYPAWVLHRRPLGEDAFLVSFYTPQGLIPAIHKPSRNIKNAVNTQLFMPFWVDFSFGYRQIYLRKIEAIGPSLFFNQEAMFCAYYANELMVLSLLPEDPNLFLYEAYSTLLAELSQAKIQMEFERVLRGFERDLLMALGQAISFEKEACGEKNIRHDKCYQFTSPFGFTESIKGFPGDHLLAFHQNDFADPRILKTLKQVMRVAIDHLLEGKKLLSRRLFIKQSKEKI